MYYNQILDWVHLLIILWCWVLEKLFFFFSGCFLLVLVVHKYSVLRTTSFKENNELQRRCAQILISTSRAINPLYPIILPKVMANLCRGGSKYNRRDRDVFDISGETPPSMERVHNVCKSSAHGENATVMVGRLHPSSAKVKQIRPGSSLSLSRRKRRQACT